MKIFYEEMNLCNIKSDSKSGYRLEYDQEELSKSKIEISFC